MANISALVFLQILLEDSNYPLIFFNTPHQYILVSSGQTAILRSFMLYHFGFSSLVIVERYDLPSVHTTLPLLEACLQIQRSQALLEAVGIDMVNNCMTLPALGTAGGIFMMALERYFSLQLASITKYTISATITMIAFGA
jgi:hypothetical protein